MKKVGLVVFMMIMHTHSKSCNNKHKLDEGPS